tara:strand:- start:135 stop:440 length:306 start_codon:yes stop_codon:yes gene_type:complete
MVKLEMRRNNTNTIGQIIKKILSNNKLSKRLDVLNVLDVWNNIIGKDLEKYIKSTKLVDDKLHVKLRSSIVRNEMSYKKTQLIQRINKKLNKEVIKDIILK